ncbi:TPR-like protein [Dichomitus squalens]|uniref:TPR-like protein n=1 Tax=Dichomitus squalens TaxID=114155 RepID=A0A4Q9PIV8_9APHY|nr:TPR-like protein [Dichomitus squalens]
MSIRHTPRQAERDIRLHDPHHSHSLPPPSHPHPHPPHLNGNGLATPAAHAGPSRGAPLASQVLSPSAQPAAANGEDKTNPLHILNQANEQTWLMIGRVAEQMGNLEHALSAYENALRHNSHSLPGLTQVAGIARIKENYPKAVEYFQAALQVQGDNGEVWSALGHCYLMQDDLQKAYAAYQQALYFLPNPKEDPKLWYGIGILYDRYGSLDHAEEAFSSVLKMDKDFDKANEILFRLGIIYKQQGKYAESLECFDRILRNPPSPLAHADIWFQIGHVFEQQRDHVRARDAYERVVHENPNHAKVLQQLGWLYHQDGSTFQNQEAAIQYLTKSLEAEPGDAQSWYLLGRAYMAGQKYNKAYEAYQQAVYRDGRNPTFWCSIGVLYFQINQYRDALDAYSRAIRINPYISEVWFDLGSLYESCNNQISDAIDAYARAAELDPTNTAITQRLALLKNAQATGQALPAAPGPQDVHPTAYANPMMPPAGLGGPPLMMQGSTRPLFPSDARSGPTDLPLPVPPQLQSRNSPGPFRGGPPPPVVLDESRHAPSHAPLAPMDVDRPPMREHSNSFPPPPGRDVGPRGPAGGLLHHPAPQSQGPPEALRHPQHPHESPFHPMRVPSTSASPPPYARPRSVMMNYPERPPLGPAQSSSGPRRSSPPPAYPREEPGWNRRVPVEVPEWDREPRGRPVDYTRAPPSHIHSRPHSPPVPQRRNSSRSARDRSPPEVSPRIAHPGYPGSQYWEPKTGVAGPARRASPPPTRPPVHEMAHESAGRRYDPAREYEREVMLEPRGPDPRYAGSPDAIRMQIGNQQQLGAGARTSESPHLAAQQAAQLGDPKQGRRRQTRDKDAESNSSGTAGEPAKKERKRRAPQQKRVKEEGQRLDGQYENGPVQSAFKLEYRPTKGVGSPDPSSNGSASASRSVQPSPTNSTHFTPSRHLDEDYDEGVADALIGLKNYQPSDPRGFGAPSGPASARLPSAASPPQQHLARRPSVSSRTSPSTNKRPLSPGPEDHPDVKRSRVGSMSQRVSPPTNGRPTPTPGSGTRLSPIPFRQQPTSHSPDMRQPPQDSARSSYPPSPQLPITLPPHPRPIGAGLAGHLPSMTTTRSPPSNVTSPAEDERMHSRSASPPRGKIMLHSAQGSAGSPVVNSKGTSSPTSGNGNGTNARPSGPPS